MESTVRNTGIENIGFVANSRSHVEIETFTLHQHVSGEPRKKKKKLAISNIRMIENTAPNFTGREVELKEIREIFVKLEKNENPLSRMVVLTGSGGMGKSELSKCYAAKFKTEHPNVIFLNSESPASLNKCMVEVALKLHIAEVTEESEGQRITRLLENFQEILTEIYAIISRDLKGALIIFDNAVSLKSTGTTFGIEDYLPKTSHLFMPFFLVTSRNPTFWISQVEPIEIFPVSLLSNADSLEFLAKMYRLKSTPDDLRSLFDDLASYFRGYPLGLNLMSNIQIIGGKDLETGIRRLIQKLKLIKNELHLDDCGMSEGKERYKLLEALFDAKIESISSEDNLAVEILGILAYLHPDFINVGLCYRIIQGLVTHVGFNTKLEEIGGSIQKAFQILQENNLLCVYFDNDCWIEKIKIHRVVQKLARMRLEALKDGSIFEKTLIWFESSSTLVWSWTEKENITYFVENILLDDEKNLKPSFSLLCRIWLLEIKHSAIFKPVIQKHYEMIETRLKTVKEDSPHEMILLQLGRLSLIENHCEENEGRLGIEQVSEHLHAIIGTVVSLKDIWKISLCCRCLKFVPKDSKNDLSRKLFNIISKIMDQEIIPNEVATKEVLGVASNCFDSLGDALSHNGSFTSDIVSMLLNLNPDSLEFASKYWAKLNVFLANQEVAAVYLRQGGIDQVVENLKMFSFLLEKLNRNSFPLSYILMLMEFIARLMETIDLLAFKFQGISFFLDSLDFLESLKVFTSTALRLHMAYPRDTGTYQAVSDVIERLILLWIKLETKAQPLKSVVEIVVPDLRKWLDFVRLNPHFLWIDEFNKAKLTFQIAQEYAALPGSATQPILLDSARWITIFSNKLNRLSKFENQSDYVDHSVDSLPIKWFQEELSQRLETFKDHENNASILELLRCASVLYPSQFSLEGCKQVFQERNPQTNSQDLDILVKEGLEIIGKSNLILLKTEPDGTFTFNIHPYVQGLLREKLTI